MPMPKHATHALRMIDNSTNDAYQDTVLAFKRDDQFYYFDNPEYPVIQYVGDEILEVWHLMTKSDYQALADRKITEKDLFVLNSLAGIPLDDVAVIAKHVPQILNAVTAWDEEYQDSLINRIVLNDVLDGIKKANDSMDPDLSDLSDIEEVCAAACVLAMPPAARQFDATSSGYGKTVGEAVLPSDLDSTLFCTDDAPKSEYQELSQRRDQLIESIAMMFHATAQLDKAIANTEFTAN